MGSSQPHRQAWLDYWQVSPRAGCVWGFDIGGANLKVACLRRTDGHVTTQVQAFALWRHPLELNTQLQSLTASLTAPDQIVITMTGEIADCFPNKASGVATIVEQCEMAFARLGIPIRYYAQSPTIEDDAWLTADQAIQKWPKVAAANWHAVARFWGDYLMTQYHAPGLIADLGSTTLDLTIVAPQQPLQPATDWERIQQGRLIYTGARRSPLSMILPAVNFHGLTVPLAQELFATIHDAYLMTGLLAEDEDQTATADGRPATRIHAAQRIAKLFCSDAQELPDGLIQQVAEQAQQKHLQQIATALDRLWSEAPTLSWLLILGEGERLLDASIPLTRKSFVDGTSKVFVAGTRKDFATGTRKDFAAGTIQSGAELLGPDLSRAMPAVAIAFLAP
jgi:(4-(4-[2-(gamma-L-glutamylamino)ethyl]phenoxymethyl)furan-2-yl)methanamine synthase